VSQGANEPFRPGAGADSETAKRRAVVKIASNFIVESSRVFESDRGNPAAFIGVRAKHCFVSRFGQVLLAFRRFHST
jgi:hypothetical protein